MRTHLTRRVAVIVIAILLTGATVAWALRPDVIDVDIRRAGRSAMRVTIDEDGKTRVKNRFSVTAPVAGRLERITLREGDSVSKGHVVAWLSPLPLDSAARRIASARLSSALAIVEEASARVQQATVALDLARSAHARSKTLLDAGATSAEQYERASAELRSRSQELGAARSRLRSTQAEVAEARAALAPESGVGARRIPVRAPAAGHVLRVPESSERVVAPGAPIVEIGDARSIEVVADVLSSDAVRIVPGDGVEIAEWGGETALAGRVRSVEPAAFTRVSALGVEEQRVNVITEIIDPPPTLGDGYRVEARIVVWSSPDVLTIPASAVFQRGGRWEVFTVENSRAHRRRVEIGHRNSAMVEIVAGLSSDEPVILFPSDQIEDGARIRAHSQE